jgi:hypothetical protein
MPLARGACEANAEQSWQHGKGCPADVLSMRSGRFHLGYVRGRSISAGVIGVVGGLFSTAVYLFLFWPQKDRDRREASNPADAKPNSR